MRLRLEIGASQLDPAALELEIERELNRPVQIVTEADAPLAITLSEPGRLTLEYLNERSGWIERSIDLPANPRRAQEVIALLVGNVVRDEAAELLRSLEPAPKDEAAPPLEAAEAEPAPSPEPPRTEPPPAPPERAPPETPAPRDVEQEELIRGPLRLNASLFHPVAVRPDSQRRLLNLELGLMYSNVGAIHGFAFNLGALVIHQGLRGFAFSSWTVVHGVSRGASTSLLLNETHGDFRGALLSSGVNLGETQHGAAVAAGANILRETSYGALIAPVNVAKVVRGVSIGVVNIADRVDGLQLGVVNVAREVRGASIGLASIAGNGSIQPVLWLGTARPSYHVAAKFLVGYVYSELGLAFSPDERALESGLGLHLRLFRTLYVEPGVHYTDIHLAGTVEPDYRNELHYRLRLGLRLFDAFDVFAGGDAIQRLSGGTDGPRVQALFGVAVL